MFKGVKKFLSDLRKKSFKGWVSGGRAENNQMPEQIRSFSGNGSTGTTVGYDNVYISYGSAGPNVISERSVDVRMPAEDDKRIEKKPV